MSDAADGGYRPYPAYKDSGVEWLGEVPEHWEVRRLKTVAEVNLSNVDKKSAEGQDPVSLCNYTDVYYNEHITNQIDFMRATATPEQIKRFSLKDGDVLITKDSESWDDIAVPAVVSEDLDNVLCGYHLAMIRPNEQTNGRFLARAFSAVGPKDQFQIKANGITRFGLGGDAIRTGLFPFPPLPEQHAIAAFLDHKTAEIDALIAAKERLIALLREKRAALITQAVTKGLDPDVPMKDSGVEWLGEVPDHWEVKRLKAIACIIDGDRGTEYPNTEDFVNEGIPFISSKNIKENELVLDDVNFISPEKFKALRQGKLSRDDLIITVRGTIGNVAIFDSLEFQTAFINAQMMIIRPNSKVGSRFLFHVMRGHYWNEQVVTASYGTAQQQLSNKILSNLFILVPALDDQVYISLFVDKFAKELERLINKVQLGVYRLREYRTALISAAVTGKIDVRDL